MDNLTHTLTGLALSRAGLHRFSAHAPLVLMLSANVPDLDIVALTGGALNYFEYHRGPTHSIAMLPLMAILPVLVVLAIARSTKGWRSAYVLSLIGVASHLLLDWTNAYGIRLLLPFSGEWFHADLNSVIDIWIWGALLLALIGPLLGRLVSSEIGAKPGSGQGLAIFALAFFLVYDFGRYLLHQRAMETLNSRIYDGAAPTRVGAFPGAVSPIRWVGWADTPRTATRFDLNVLLPFDPAAGTEFFKPDPAPAMDAARQTESFKVMQNFALYPLWSLSPADQPEGAIRVELRDERFPFAATAIVDRSNRVLRSSFHY
jgi:inner membrane protein